MKSGDPQYYIKGVLEQNKRILSKTITLIESPLPEHQEIERVIIEKLLPHTGNSIRLGITGVPGAGKSVFIESLGMLLLEKGYCVAVLAVDPSSTRSGGSILADKTRMEKLSAEKSAFIRPSPSGGSLGGVARKTRETMLVCEAAGFDVIIVETVGVGQSETAVSSMVDFFLVLMIAGAGDEIQGLKKGILELADTIAINKADGDNIEKAKKARRDYESVLHLLYPASPTWTPPVLTCSALEMKGIEEIWDTVLKHREAFKETGELSEKRQKQAVEWMWSIINEGLRNRFNNNPVVKRILPKMMKDIESGKLEPTTAAYKLLFFLDKGVVE